jgi:hypothetical protein
MDNVVMYSNIKKFLFFILLIYIFSPMVICESQIRPVLTQSPIKLDGLLVEPAWENAEPINDFTQRELSEGASPTEKTEVRILYDNNNLYIGVICYDSEPEKIIHKELKLDGNLKSDDMFAFVIDTYNDKRMGQYFEVNPNGARFDASFNNGVQIWSLNEEWDGIWDVYGRITEYGWSVEIVIPFKTLRYPSTETQVWGINFMRIIQRKHEEVLWRGWKRNDGIFQLSKAGTLHIAEPLKKGLQLDVKPYILTGVERELDSDSDEVFNYGLDVTYGLDSNTTLTLTTKTDFAQIESDKEIINLTRFNLRYPEKRDFFLEGAETFSFTQGSSNLFYSRRIGISPEREEVPILGGIKLTQKTGSFRIGIMSMQTDEKNGYPQTNYSAIRVKKDIFEQSYVGFIATNLLDGKRHDNQLYGVDFKYRTDKFLTDKNFEVDASVAGTVTDGKTGKSMAERITFLFFPTS